jgi:hypothetical protein
MAKLKKAVKRKWVEALRSGKYQQTKDRLASPTGYCCLGVLCEVAIESGLPLDVDENRGFKLYDNTSVSLPTSVCEWAFLKSDPAPGNAKVKTKVGHEDWLSNINDRGASFDEIADMIEEHL